MLVHLEHNNEANLFVYEIFYFPRALHEGMEFFSWVIYHHALLTIMQLTVCILPQRMAF